MYKDILSKGIKIKVIGDSVAAGAGSRKILLVDNYKYIMEHLAKNQLVIDDIMYGEGCLNDGLHPSDYVQKLMFQNLIKTLQI